MQIATLRKVIDRVSVVVPLLLFLLVLVLRFVVFREAVPDGDGGFGFSFLSPVLNIWKSWRNIAYLFYLVTLGLNFWLWFFDKDKKSRSLFTSYKIWLIGFIGTTFSYALAGLVVDLGFALYYLSLAISKNIFGLNC